jgi:hypothetical protein
MIDIAPPSPTDSLHVNGVIDPAIVEAEKAAGPLYGLWKLRTLADAYEDRQPLRYLVAGLLPCPSLSIMYGGPGSLKSMLLADMAVCVAAGQRWLEPIPGATGPMATFNVDQAPVFWIDFDNGTRRTDERIDAFGRGRGLPIDTPLTYVSMPTPWLNASQRDKVMELALLIKHLAAKLIIIDNLGLITGDKEENSAEMAQVMGNLRWLCEETEAAVIVVHHQRKSSGAAGAGIRKGESLRGHSSIEAALDLALLVERKEGDDKITIYPTKVRGFREYESFGARFTYEHREGTKDLATARFFAEQSMSLEQAALLKLRNTIINVLIANRSMVQKDLVDEVRDTMAAEPGGSAPAINKVRGIIKQMVKDGDVEETGGNRTERLYSAVRRRI